MEKQNIQQVDQTPVGQSANNSKSPKTNYLLIGGIILVCFVAFGFGGYYLGKQSTNSPIKNNLNQQIPIPKEVSTTSIPTTTNAPAVNKMTLVDTLSKNCINSKIALDKLPFTLSQNLKNTYNVQDTINCSVPEESFASMSLRLNTPDFNGNKRVIYFFHENSKYFGLGNYLQSLSNYHQVTIDGQNYWLSVIDPGPYGISTLGVWVKVIGEKKDPASGTIVRVIDAEILKNQDLLDLVKKYGVKQTEPGFPEYIVTDPNKKTQFIQEIVSLAGQHGAFKKPAQEVSLDLNGVSF